MKYFVIIALGSILALGAVVKLSEPHQTAFPTQNPVIEAVNTVRVEHGLSQLLESKKLDSIALTKVKDMCSKNYWSHNSPTKSWLDFYAGYTYGVAGENLAEGYANTPTLIEAWVQSPEHYSNIVDSRFTKVGVATIICPNYLGSVDVPITANEFSVL